MALTAILLRDERDGPRTDRTFTGLEVHELWRVNTDDHDAALGAAGLPAMGSAHPVYGALLVSRQSARFFAGTNDGGTEGGFSTVDITYSPAGGRGVEGNVITPVANAGYAEVEVGVQTATIYNEITDAGDSVPNSPPINNKEGTPVEGVGTVVRIIRYLTAGTVTSTLIHKWLAMCGSTNDASVVTPALLGIGPAMTFLAEELRYRSFKVERVGSLIQVTHEMVMAVAVDIATGSGAGTYPGAAGIVWQTIKQDGTADELKFSRTYRKRTWESL